MILFMKVFFDIKSLCLICICVFKLDETITERLWGLTEMFPDTVRTAAEVSAQCSVSLVKKFYRYIHQDLSCYVAVVAPNSSLRFDKDCEHVSVFPARHSGWVLPPSWSLCSLWCLRLKDYSWSSSSYNSRDRWVFMKREAAAEKVETLYMECMLNHSFPSRSCWGPTLECLVGCRAWCLQRLGRFETGGTNGHQRPAAGNIVMLVIRRGRET